MPERKSTWQLQEAKNKLSEVIRRAREEGPQTITVRGEAVAIVRAYGPDNRPAESIPTATEMPMRQPSAEYVAAPSPTTRARTVRDEPLHELFRRSPAAGMEFEVPAPPRGDAPPIFDEHGA